MGQIYGGDFAKFCGLLRIYQLYLNMFSDEDKVINCRIFGLLSRISFILLAFAKVLFSRMNNTYASLKYGLISDMF